MSWRAPPPGADGMAETFAKALTLGGTGLGLARRLLASMNQDAPAANANGSGHAATAGLDGSVPPKPETVPVDKADEEER